MFSMDQLFKPNIGLFITVVVMIIAVNHFVDFVDPVSTTHTNTVESKK